jgi:DNA-binding GntR family transcriptional regulator
MREPHSLRLSTVSTLRRAILNLTFKPGEKLTERVLCELTGVAAA